METTESGLVEQDHETTESEVEQDHGTTELGSGTTEQDYDTTVVDVATTLQTTNASKDSDTTFLNSDPNKSTNFDTATKPTYSYTTNQPQPITIETTSVVSIAGTVDPDTTLPSTVSLANTVSTNQPTESDTTFEPETSDITTSPTTTKVHDTEFTTIKDSIITNQPPTCLLYTSDAADE